MRKPVMFGLVLLLFGTMFAFAGEQQDTSPLPKYLVFMREDIKVGQTGTHDALWRQLRQTADSRKSGSHWITGNAVAGNLLESITFEGFDSFAELEQSRKAFSEVLQANYARADFVRDSTASHNNIRSMIAKFREDLSYNTKSIVPAKARYWQVVITRYRPGTEAEVEDNHKQVAAAMKQHNADVHWATYQVLYGMPGTVYIRFTALNSLADLDVDRSSMMEKVWSPTLRRTIETSSRDAVQFRENLLIEMRPEVSRPPDAMVAANPDFWTVKADESAVAGREGRRPVRPAAQREPEKPR